LPKTCLSILYKSRMSGVCQEQQIHDINKQTVSFHHHLLQPPFDCHPPCMLTTTTTWCCHVTSWMKHDGSWRRPGMSTDVPRHPDGDNACRHHCPHNFRWAATPSHFLTWKAGATSKTVTQQPTMDQQQQHVMYTNNRQGWGEHHNPPCPAPFSDQKQEPRRHWWCSNPQWTTKMNKQPRWQMNVTTTTNEGWQPGTSTDVPHRRPDGDDNKCRHCPHWSRWVIPVPLLLLTWKQGPVATCQPTTAEWWLTTNDATMSRWAV